MGRQLNISKRFPLAHLGEAWNDCYVDYRPMTVADLIKVKELDAERLDSAEGMQFLVDHVKGHVVGGKVSVANEGEPADLDASDVESLPFETLIDLFTEMTGVTADPKGSVTAAVPATAPPSVTSPTETS